MPTSPHQPFDLQLLHRKARHSQHPATARRHANVEAPLHHGNLWTPAMGPNFLENSLKLEIWMKIFEMHLRNNLLYTLTASLTYHCFSFFRESMFSHKMYCNQRKDWTSRGLIMNHHKSANLNHNTLGQKLHKNDPNVPQLRGVSLCRCALRAFLHRQRHGLPLRGCSVGLLRPLMQQGPDTIQGEVGFLKSNWAVKTVMHSNKKYHRDIL